MSTGHLDQLLLGIADRQVLDTPGAARMIVSGLTLDSRQVRRGDAFVALRGTQTHGIAYVAGAVRHGACVVLAETPGAGEALPEPDAADTPSTPAANAGGALPLSMHGVPVLWIDDLHAQVGEIAARFYDRPAESMHIVGVTGTNGKTSCVQLLAQALTFLGYRAASIGTLGAGLDGHLHAGERTTPDAISVQAQLAGFRELGVTHVAMEVSSHALAQDRVGAVDFEIAAFTNLTRDHLDYHGSMQAYGAAKARLFAWPGLQTAVLNIDDAFGAQLLAELMPGIQALPTSMSAAEGAVVSGDSIVTSAEGLTFVLHTPWGTRAVSSHLLGRFNVANLLTMVACLGALGEPFARIVAAVASVHPVNGRMNRLGGAPGQPLVVVDYAHTPDALEKVLTALRAHCAGRLVCVFGCGGERDVGKRPLMGEIAARLADVAIVTDDNPRGEDGSAIIAQIVAGMQVACTPAQVERDRAKAIHMALAAAQAGDVVLIAGKGHETYQDGAGGKHPFDDMAVAHGALERLLREPRA
ncbi:MAG: UDP-N-acetylmuramoyl-L-alanyl-D-glutamate--2,6-diaminopimelate ligase [Rhodanobacter sp.]